MLGLVAILLLANPAPLVCPPGTKHHGAAPPEGYEERCERPDPAGRPRRHGPARTYYDTGILWTESSWSDGQREGPFLEQYRNGKPARQGLYRNGQKTGVWKLWYEDGGPMEEAGWERGVQHGHFVSWHPNGQKKTEGRYCGGMQCGRWSSWAEDGATVGSVDYAEILSAP